MVQWRRFVGSGMLGIVLSRGPKRRVPVGLGMALAVVGWSEVSAEVEGRVGGVLGGPMATTGEVGEELSWLSLDVDASRRVGCHVVTPVEGEVSLVRLVITALVGVMLVETKGGFVTVEELRKEEGLILGRGWKSVGLSVRRRLVFS